MAADTDDMPVDRSYVFDPAKLEPGVYVMGVVTIHPSLGRDSREIPLPIGPISEPPVACMVFLIWPLVPSRDGRRQSEY